jgi:MFS family permease
MLSNVLAPALARRGIHYGWAVVAVTFLTMLATSAAMGMPGVLLLPLRNEFGWDLGEISGALALRLLLFGLVAPFAAALMQRYGMRAVVGSALGVIVVSLALATQMTVLWELWLTWGLLIGLSTGVTANVLGATVANRQQCHRATAVFAGRGLAFRPHGLAHGDGPGRLPVPGLRGAGGAGGA